MDIEQGRPHHTCDRGMTAPGETCPACEYHPPAPERTAYPRWVPVTVWLWVLGILSILLALALAASTN